MKRSLNGIIDICLIYYWVGFEKPGAGARGPAVRFVQGFLSAYKNAAIPVFLFDETDMIAKSGWVNLDQRRLEGIYSETGLPQRIAGRVEKVTSASPEVIRLWCGKRHIPAPRSL